MKEIKLMNGVDVLNEMETNCKTRRDMFMMGHSQQSSFEAYFRLCLPDLPKSICRDWFMAGSTKHWTYESLIRFKSERAVKMWNEMDKGS